MPAPADAERWATQLAASHGVELAGISWATGTGGAARMTDAGAELVLAPEILVDVATMRFHVAHEVGHVVLGHARGRRQQLRAAAPYLAAGGVVELAAIVGAAFWRWSIVMLPIAFVITWPCWPAGWCYPRSVRPTRSRPPTEHRLGWRVGRRRLDSWPG